MFKRSVPVWGVSKNSPSLRNGLIDRIFPGPATAPRDDRYVDPGNRWITDQDPIVGDYKKLKGTKADIVQLLYETGVLKATPRVHTCKYFRAWFFPTSHFVSLFRKSRPAVHIGVAAVEPYNGAKFDIKDDFNVRSHVPTDYAVYRGEIKRAIKRAFMDRFNSESPDGLYFIQTMNVMPTRDTHGDLVLEIQKMLNSSIRLTRDQNLDWVRKANSNVKEHRLDRICIQNHYPKVQLSNLPKLTSGSGNKSKPLPKKSNKSHNPSGQSPAKHKKSQAPRIKD